MGSIKLQLRSTLSPKVVKTKARPSTFVASLLHTYLVTSGLDLGLKPELELCISGGAVTLDLEETVGGEALSKGTIVEVRRRRKARRPPSSPLLLSPRLGVGNEKEVISRGTEVNFESSTEEGGGLDEWEDTPSRLPRPRQMSGLAVCTSAYSSSTPTVASRPGPGSSVSPEDSSTSEAIGPTPPTRSLSDEFDYDNLDDAFFAALELPPIPDEMPSRLGGSPSQLRMSTRTVGVSPAWAPPSSEPGCISPIRYRALRRSVGSKGKVECKGKVEDKAAVGVSGGSKRWDGTEREKKRPATDFLGQVHCPALASASNSPSQRSAPDWEELSPALEPRRAQPDDDINDDLPQWVVATQVLKRTPTTSLPPPSPGDGASGDGDADELDQLDPDSQEREIDRASMEIFTRMPRHSSKKPATSGGPAHPQAEDISAQKALSIPYSAPSHRPPPLNRPQVYLGPPKSSLFASTCPTLSSYSDPRLNLLDASHSCSPTNTSLLPPSPSSPIRPTKKAKLSSTALRKPPSLPLSSLPLYHSHPRYQPSMPAVQRQDTPASVVPSVTEPPSSLLTKTFSTYLPVATPASSFVAESCSPITPRVKLEKFSFQRPSTGAAATLSSVSATASASPAPRQEIASSQSNDEVLPPSSEPWDDDEDAVFDEIEDSTLAKLELPAVAPNKKETPISMMVSFSPSTSPSTSYAPQPQPSPVTFHDIDSTVLADDDSVIDRLMLGCKGLLGTQIARECGLFGGEDGEDEDDDDEVAIYGLRYKTPPPPSKPPSPPKPLVANPTPPDLDADVSLSLRLTALIPPPSTPPELHTAYHAAHLPQSILHQILAYAIDPSRTTNVSFLLVSHLFHALSRPLLYTDVSLRSLNGWAALFLQPSSLFTVARARGARRADDYAHIRKLSLLSPAPMPDDYADDPGDDDEAMKRRRQIVLAINMTLAHHRLAYDKTTGPRPLFPRLERLTIDLSASLGQTQLAQFNLDFLSTLAPLPAGGFSRLASGRSREATTMSWESQQPRPPLDVIIIGARDPSQVLGVLACLPAARGVRLRWPERGAKAALEAVARDAGEQGRPVWLPSTEGDSGWAENWVDEEERKESWRRRARK